MPEQPVDVEITQVELMDASAVLIEFLKAWETRLWANMARLVHMPRPETRLRRARTEILKRQFEQNPLVTFEEDINVVKANGDWHVEANGSKTRIAFIDFAVVVIVGNEKMMTRQGVFVRMVLVDALWKVNPWSLNRRFDPQLADDVRQEGQEQEQEADDGQQS